MTNPIVRPFAPLVLTQNEARLRKLLLDFATWRSTQPSAANTSALEIRWAGGWVRDKLLGIASHDIDIAINCMTGEAFGLELAKFCQEEEAAGIKQDELHGLHLIRLNPEKSKNLETATTRLFGIDLDFVNLRKETYAEDSRNPEIEFGTAYEDATRRDATVNALFYNIHTDLIEDFTGGLEDMEAKLIKTPLQPFQTFMDDPLRVLRLVRFSSRLGFEIVKESRESMQDPQVLEALAQKITRERVGIELDKMLKGKNPRDALILIANLNLYHAIFTDVTRPEIEKPDVRNWPSAYNLLSDMCQDISEDSLYALSITDPSDLVVAWYLACMCPWENVPEPAQVGPKTKANSVPLVVSIARQGFRATNKICDVLLGAHRNLSEIRQFKESVLEGDDWASDRGKIGMMLRRWEGNAMNWKLQLIYAMLTEALSIAPSGQSKLKDLEASWRQVFQHIKKMELLDAHLVRGLVDGRSLSAALGVKPGKWMKSALDICLEWQFNHPGTNETAPAIEIVRSRAAELGITGLKS